MVITADVSQVYILVVAVKQEPVHVQGSTVESAVHVLMITQQIPIDVYVTRTIHMVSHTYTLIAACVLLKVPRVKNPQSCSVHSHVAGRGCPFYWELSGYNTESLTKNHTW